MPPVTETFCDQALPTVAGVSAPLAGDIVTAAGAVMVSDAVAFAEVPALLLAL
ncbi:hypothetical protein BN128_3928 [Cronobacter sakazakii 696]|nr:hypothetical protein BN128_3928 [Cronobacter sakazakii 696]